MKTETYLEWLKERGFKGRVYPIPPNKIPNIIKTKKCVRCGKVVPLDQFPVRNRSICNECSILVTHNHEDIYARAFRLIKYHSRHEFYITLEQVKTLAEKQKHRCALTNTPFCTEVGISKEDRSLLPSIDRIDSNKEYTIDNIQLVVAWINVAKSNYPNEFFQKLLKTTVDNLR